MRWKGREGSENVEDRRGMGAGPMLLGGGGIFGLLLMLAFMFMGGDPRQAAPSAEQLGGGGQAQQAQEVETDPEEDEAVEFVKVIFKDTEDVWTSVFEQSGQKYRKPKMVVYRRRTDCGCGTADAGMGPFYCPVDETVYIDPAFFKLMDARKLGSPGEFARAYVVAHEVGHHVQKLLGLTQKVDAARRQQSEEEANEMSVRLELQADFLAGVWANLGQREKKFLDKGDIEQGLECAKRIGDDFLQRRSRGTVDPDSFTHGTAEQRYRWLLKGIQSGDINQMDTFKIPYERL